MIDKNKIDFIVKCWAIGATYLLLAITVLAIKNNGILVVNVNKYNEQWIDIAVFSATMILSVISLSMHIKNDRKEIKGAFKK